MPLPSFLSRPSAALTAIFRNERVVGTTIAAWLILAALFGGYWVQLERSHAALVSQAETLTRLRALQTAHALALHTRALFRKLDYLSQDLGEHWLKEGREGSREALLRAQLALPDGTLAGINVADAEGRLVYSTVGEQTPLALERFGIADYAHFRVHLEGRERLFIGEPYRGRMTGTWIVPISPGVTRR